MEKKILIENKAVSVDDTKTTFGLKSITRPTPVWATHVFRFVLYAALILTLVTNTVSEIPAEAAATINKYALEAVALVHGISKLLGLKEVK